MNYRIKLPYSLDALSPIISKENLDEHYNINHKNYEKDLIELTKHTSMEGEDLVDIINHSDGPVYNNAAQCFNHNLLWNSLSPKTTLTPAAMKPINETFDNFGTFVKEVVSAGKKQFGSGWLYITLDNGKLKIQTTANAEIPQSVLDNAHGNVWVLDLWEHMYQIQYPGDRGTYLEQIVHLINWSK